MSESFFEEKPAVNYPAPETAPSSYNAKPEQKGRGSKPFLNHELTGKQIQKREPAIKKVENIQKKEPPKNKDKIHGLMKGFSMKKAVVYSEIIRIKY